MHPPRCSQLHLGLIQYGLPKVQLPLYKLNKVKSSGAHLFLFYNWGSKEVLILESCPMFLNKLLMGQSIWLLKEKKSCERTHDLNNMKHTLCPHNLFINHHQIFIFHYLPLPWLIFFQKNMVDAQAHLDPWIIHVLGV